MHPPSHLLCRSHRLPWQSPDHAKHYLLNPPNPIDTRIANVPARSSKFTCEFNLGTRYERDDAAFPFHVFIGKSGRASRYVLDGSRLRLVGLEEERPDLFCSGDMLRRLLEVSGSAARRLFVPHQVPENYMGYLKWKLVHRVFSSALQVLATQAMFRAIGIGSTPTLPSAAAMNWVLKSGLGRLSRCIYTASLGSSFDTNLKRVMFSTSVFFSLSIGIEMLTPIFSEHFLLLASIANIAKSISLAAYLATGSAIHRSFALADNLGEVSAKAQIQTVCFDSLGLVLAALLNALCKNTQRLQGLLLIAIYPLFSVVDLLAIYNALKYVHLRTLTKGRLEIIIDTWIQSGYVPSPAEVSSKEDIYLLRMKVGSRLWPIRIGCFNPEDILSTISNFTLQSLNDVEQYFLSMEISPRGLARKKHPEILLCLRETACTLDIVIGLVQACKIRNSILMHQSRWELLMIDRRSLLMDLFKLVEDSKIRGKEDAEVLVESMRTCGWATKSILLNSEEQIRYGVQTDECTELLKMDRKPVY